MPSSADAGAGGRTLVTGAAGFVGARLVRSLLDGGEDVVALVRPGSRLWRLEDVLDRVELLEVDVGALDARSAALRDVRVVHHLAAAGVDPRDGDPGSILATNVLGTQATLEVARVLEVDRFVYCGSCFEYGSGSRLREDAPLRPRSTYAASKAAGRLLAEAAAAAHGLPVVTLRPFTAYGPFEAAHRLVPSCILNALAGRPIELTAGEQRRDLVHVDDVATAFVAAARNPAAVGRTLNVCSGEETRVRDVAATVLELVGGEAELRLGALPQRPGETDALSGDPAAAEQVLGLRPTPLREGLARTVDWFRAHSAAYDLAGTAS